MTHLISIVLKFYHCSIYGIAEYLMRYTTDCASCEIISSGSPNVKLSQTSRTTVKFACFIELVTSLNKSPVHITLVQF